MDMCHYLVLIVVQERRGSNTPPSRKWPASLNWPVSPIRCPVDVFPQLDGEGSSAETVTSPLPSSPFHGSTLAMADPVEGAKRWVEMRLALEQNPSWELHLGQECFTFTDDVEKKRFARTALGLFPPNMSGS